jgi:tRNA modification GTPase
MDTIAAIATAPGVGAISIIRVSGDQAWEIGKKISGTSPIHRTALFCEFKNHDNETLDEGLLLGFRSPQSFTGEDVIELQGHGGSMVPRLLLDEVIRLGARLAEPGEFSLRAFLNNKIDLTQAEAISDLIESDSIMSAKASINSLQGQFSEVINITADRLMELRTYIEAFLDFPDEEIPEEDKNTIQRKFVLLIKELKHISKIAWQGEAIRKHKKVVILGEPNAGKSSLMNLLGLNDISIVTSSAGTTRDLIEKEVIVEDIKIHLVDTAGIRDEPESIEKIGIEKAFKAIHDASLILWVHDFSQQGASEIPAEIVNSKTPIIEAMNKIDLLPADAPLRNDKNLVYISAKNGEGVDSLKKLITQKCLASSSETLIASRARHAERAEACEELLTQSEESFLNGSLELSAEFLKKAHDTFGEITGKITPDDLLGSIFSSFCIGK